jgi:hypothetical protein
MYQLEQGITLTHKGIRQPLLAPLQKVDGDGKEVQLVTTSHGKFCYKCVILH